MSGINVGEESPKSIRSYVLLAGLGLAVAVSGCAHVNQEDLDSELAQIREEVREGDRQNADAIDQVGQRVDGLDGRLASLESDLQSLEQEFNTTVQRLESSLRFSTPVHFAYDEAEIRQEDEQFLDRFAGVVGEYYPDATVTVEGFTDPAGSAEYNLRLGQRRADAVRSYLTQNSGLSDERIRAVSYGESTDRLIDPQGQGPGERGLPNRRVVLVVDHVSDGSGGAPTTVGPTEGSSGS